MVWVPWEIQERNARKAFEILKEHGFVYLAGEERSGKLLTSVRVAELTSDAVQNVLVLTTKKALAGWQEMAENYTTSKVFYFTNYHQAKNVTFKPDLVILDECHNYLSSYPKPSQLWGHVAKLCRGLAIIYSSATPHPQGYQQLYHQFKLSTWSPWAKYSNFYKWFNEYGIPEVVYTSSGEANSYHRVKDDKIQAEVAKYFITCTRAETGHTFEPEDVVHYIELAEATRNTYNMLITDRVVEFADGDVYVADNNSRLRMALHQIEGGTLKFKTINFEKNKFEFVTKILSNTEKIDYILEHWGDSEDLVIMYHFSGELEKLRRYFKKALLLQSSTYAEGVDLHKYEHLVIYSQNYSTGKHSQRRARQANTKRLTPIRVHYLLVKDAISDECYQCVSIKKINYVDSVFTGKKLGEANAED